MNKQPKSLNVFSVWERETEKGGPISSLQWCGGGGVGGTIAVLEEGLLKCWRPFCFWLHPQRVERSIGSYFLLGYCRRSSWRIGADNSKWEEGRKKTLGRLLLRQVESAGSLWLWGLKMVEARWLWTERARWSPKSERGRKASTGTATESGPKGCTGLWVGHWPIDLFLSWLWTVEQGNSGSLYFYPTWVASVIDTQTAGACAFGPVCV